MIPFDLSNRDFVLKVLPLSRSYLSVYVWYFYIKLHRFGSPTACMAVGFDFRTDIHDFDLYLKILMKLIKS